MFSSQQFPAYVSKVRAPKPPARIRETGGAPGYAHQIVSGEFDAGVTEEEIRAFVYHPTFGGRELTIDFVARTFRGVRHTD